MKDDNLEASVGMQNSEFRMKNLYFSVLYGRESAEISVSKEKLIIKTGPYELILNSRFIYALYH